MLYDGDLLKNIIIEKLEQPKMTNDIKEFIKLKTNKERIIGIDWGERHLGVSITDKNWIIASPYQTFDYKKSPEVVSKIVKLIALENIIGMVVGWPINMDGSLGKQCQKVDSFIGQLSNHIITPIIRWDERLSSKAVYRTMITADLSRKKQQQVIDKMAASYMLQGFLDYVAYHAHT